MPCIVICGEDGSYNMGNGKTATMTYLGFLDFLNGRKIRANYKLKGIDYEYQPTLNQCVANMSEDHDATYLVDELSTWISCYERPSQKNDGLMLMNMAKQTRKLDIKLYYTAQTYRQIPKFLRVLTHKIYVIAKCHFIDGQYKRCEKDDCFKEHYIAIRECIQQGEQLIQPKPTVFFKLPNEIFDMYNTYEVIERVFENIPKKTAKDYR